MQHSNYLYNQCMTDIKGAFGALTMIFTPYINDMASAPKAIAWIGGFVLVVVSIREKILSSRVKKIELKQLLEKQKTNENLNK